jgi:hypothetical protein
MKKRSLFWSLAVALGVCTCGITVLSAQMQPANGVPAHTVVTVEPHDKKSNAPVINREDVMVFEGRDRDSVTEWIPAQGDHAALELFIMLDDGSNDAVGTQLSDIRKFIMAQPPSTQIGIVYMRNGTAMIVQNLTSDHEQAAKALRLPIGIAGANGSPYFSLSDLVKRWPPSAARHEVVMATDGVDRYYGAGDLQDPYVQEAIEDAQRAGIIVCGIYTPGAGHFGHSYWQTYWGQLYLAELADKTGGESYYIGFTGAPVAFAPYLGDIAHRLNNQYLLTFLAKPPKKAGLQRVKIRTEIPKVDLIAPEQVYVPAGR